MKKHFGGKSPEDRLLEYILGNRSEKETIDEAVEAYVTFRMLSYHVRDFGRDAWATLQLRIHGHDRLPKSFDEEFFDGIKKIKTEGKK